MITPATQHHIVPVVRMPAKSQHTHTNFVSHCVVSHRLRIDYIVAINSHRFDLSHYPFSTSTPIDFHFRFVSLKRKNVKVIFSHRFICRCRHAQPHHNCYAHLYVCTAINGTDEYRLRSMGQMNTDNNDEKKKIEYTIAHIDLTRSKHQNYHTTDEERAI